MISERIRQARELSGMTQTELASRVGITQAALAQIEAGMYAPSDSVLTDIAKQTGFNSSFLRQEQPPIEFPSGTILYRSLVKVSARDKARAHRLAQLAFEIAFLMKRHLKNIPVLLPRAFTEDPITAARSTRSSLGLSPDSPIPNIVTVVERAG